MANPTTGFGLKPIRHFAGGTVRANPYKIASGLATHIGLYDVLEPLSTGYVDRAEAADTLLLGSVGGFNYTATDGTVVFSKAWVASTTTKGSADVTCFVYDDPNTVFAVRSVGSITIADVHGSADLDTVADYDTGTGYSKTMALGTASWTSTAANLKLLRLNEAVDNDSGTNAVGDVLINEHVYNTTTGI